MPSDWINHVKSYQKDHGCSYKEALKCSACSYKKQPKSTMDGGKFSLPKAVKKTSKGISKASNALEKNKKFVKLVVGDEYANDIDKISRQAKRAANVAHKIESNVGGAGIPKHLGRKVKNSVQKARKVTKRVTKTVDELSPALAMISPELAPELLTLNEAVKEVNGSGLGSTLKGKKNPYIKGGSFSVPVRGGCISCSKPTEAHMINAFHPAFHPKKPKSYSELIYGV